MNAIKKEYKKKNDVSWLFFKLRTKEVYTIFGCRPSSPSGRIQNSVYPKYQNYTQMLYPKLCLELIPGLMTTWSCAQ